jgi:predicted GNAT family acetyltransferase
MTFAVRDDPEGRRFELRDGDTVAGFLAYDRADEALVLVHTEIDHAYEGQGLGSTFVREVLEQLRARGERVVVLCPFVRAFLRRHPEYADVVAA